MEDITKQGDILETDFANGSIEAVEALKDQVDQMDKGDSGNPMGGHSNTAASIDIITEWEDPNDQHAMEDETFKAEHAVMLEDLEVISADKADSDLDLLEQRSDVMDDLDSAQASDHGVVDMTDSQPDQPDLADSEVIDLVDDDGRSPSPLVEEPSSRAVSVELPKAETSLEVEEVSINEATSFVEAEYEYESASDENTAEHNNQQVNEIFDNPEPGAASQEEAVEVVEEVVEESIDEPIDEPIGELVDEPIDEPIDEPVDEPIDEPIDEPVDEPIDEPTDDQKELKIEDATENDELLNCPVEFHIKDHSKTICLLDPSGNGLLKTLPSYLLTLDRVFSLLRAKIIPEDSQELVFNITDLDLVINEDNIYTQETRVTDLVELLDVLHSRQKSLKIVVTFQARFVFRLNALFGELEAMPPAKKRKDDSHEE